MAAGFAVRLQQTQMSGGDDVIALGLLDCGYFGFSSTHNLFLLSSTFFFYFIVAESMKHYL